jgi:outer membrane protein assembly factor BamB
MLYIGICGSVLALDRTTGNELWRTDLKGADFVNVAFHDGDLFATAKGVLFCLDPATGSIRWKNSLKGLGHGLITIATPAGQQTVLAREKRKRDDDAAGAVVIAG